MVQRREGRKRNEEHAEYTQENVRYGGQVEENREERNGYWIEFSRVSNTLNYTTQGGYREEK